MKSSSSEPEQETAKTTPVRTAVTQPSSSEPEQETAKATPFLRPASVADNNEVVSFGIHRLSNAFRLIVAFVLTACATAAILGFAVFLICWIENIVLDSDVIAVLVIGTIVAVIIATAIGFVSVRGIIQPLRRITETVAEFKAQNFSARTGFTGYDEIGRLGHTLDEMAHALQDARNYEHQLTVDLAHELRTPLMAMRAILEAMIDDVIPVDKERLEIAHSSVVRLARLVDVQLELARLESRRVPLNVQRLDLGHLIGDMVSHYKILAEDLELSMSFAATKSVFVLGDLDLLRQATANLISNAIRYTPAGGKILVTVKKRGRLAEIAIEDTGIGIAKKDLEHVFTKLWRASNDRGHDDSGLGIGLTIVKEIVQMHNGIVDVESTLGVGSRFSIRIPLNVRDDKKRTKTEDLESSSEKENESSE